MERLFNTISAVVFGVLTLALLFAAFYNWVHLLFAACTATLFVAALSEDDATY